LSNPKADDADNADDGDDSPQQGAEDGRIELMDDDEAEEARKFFGVF